MSSQNDRNFLADVVNVLGAALDIAGDGLVKEVGRAASEARKEVVDHGWFGRKSGMGQDKETSIYGFGGPDAGGGERREGFEDLSAALYGREQEPQQSRGMEQSIDR